MKMRLKTLMAGPEGVFPPGSVIEVSPEEAEALIAGGIYLLHKKRLHGQNGSAIALAPIGTALSVASQFPQFGSYP